MREGQPERDIDRPAFRTDAFSRKGEHIEIAHAAGLERGSIGVGIAGFEHQHRHAGAVSDAVPHERTEGHAPSGMRRDGPRIRDRNQFKERLVGKLDDPVLGAPGVPVDRADLKAHGLEILRRLGEIVDAEDEMIERAHQTSRLCSTAAAMKLAKSGCGSKGRDFSSGWYCTPTNQG